MIRGLNRYACLNTRTPEHHTNQYLSFRSHHPTAHKFAVVRTLMTRSVNLCSLGVERTEEEKRVTDALRGNGYPTGFMQKHTITSRRREEVGLRDQRQPSHYPTLGGYLRQSDVSKTPRSQGSVLTRLSTRC